ncbi:hypothetical protein OAV26_03155 [Crocinitomicaceae bacterium]|nr:hypothetical protein [Crocinitomicaceae bacterium]
MISDVDKAYIAGLFDGEGSIHFKRKPEKKRSGTYNCMRISMEISMTDRSVLIWVHEVLGVGTLNKKPRKGKRVDGSNYLMQYRWRCTFRDAFYVCCLLWPFAHTKLHKIQQVIEHYTNEKVNMDNIVDIADFKRRKNVGQNSL